MTKPSDVERVRRQLLDGLMASDANAWEHTLYRTRLYAGFDNPREAWVRRSHASLRERAGRWGTSPEAAANLPFNNRVSKAHATLSERGWWERHRARFGGAQDGPRTPYETRMTSLPAEGRPPHTDLAYAAIKTLSLHVSPLGPEREQMLCKCWYLVATSGPGTDATQAGTREEWGDWLGCTRKTAVKYLREIAAAGVGLVLEVDDPVPPESAKRYVVRLRLPNLETLRVPDGAQRADRETAARMRAWIAGRSDAMGPPASLTTSTAGPPTDGACTASRPEKETERLPLMTDYGRDDDDCDLPWDDEEFAAPARALPGQAGGVVQTPSPVLREVRTVQGAAPPVGGHGSATKTLGQAGTGDDATQLASRAAHVVGTQLTLDGTAGRSLIRRPNGSLAYRQPQTDDRVLRTTMPKQDVLSEEERSANARVALFATREGTLTPSVEAVLRERFGVELETA